MPFVELNKFHTRQRDLLRSECKRGRLTVMCPFQPHKYQQQHSGIISCYTYAHQKHTVVCSGTWWSHLSV